MAGKSSFSIGKNVEISTVASLHERMLKAIDKSNSIDLKAEAVERIDSAGLQLILSFRRELQQSGGDLTWKHPSDKLRDAANLLGMSEELGLLIN